MIACNCTLAGTAACKTCSNIHQTTEYSFTLPTTLTYPTTFEKASKEKPVVQYWCPSCDASLDKWQRFCHCCGQEIDWKDWEDIE